MFRWHEAWVSKTDLPPNESTTSDSVADPPEAVARFVPADLLARYEVHGYRSAALILAEAHPDEFADLLTALRKFRLTREIIAKPGGSESDIPKTVSRSLRPLGWHETTIQADLLVKLL